MSRRAQEPREVRDERGRRLASSHLSDHGPEQCVDVSSGGTARAPDSESDVVEPKLEPPQLDRTQPEGHAAAEHAGRCGEPHPDPPDASHPFATGVENITGESTHDEQAAASKLESNDHEPSLEALSGRRTPAERRRTKLRGRGVARGARRNDALLLAGTCAPSRPLRVGIRRGGRTVGVSGRTVGVSGRTVGVSGRLRARGRLSRHLARLVFRCRRAAPRGVVRLLRDEPVRREGAAVEGVVTRHGRADDQP